MDAKLDGTRTLFPYPVISMQTFHFIQKGSKGCKDPPPKAGTEPPPPQEEKNEKRQTDTDLYHPQQARSEVASFTG